LYIYTSMSCRTTFPTKNVPIGIWSNVRGAAIVLPAPAISSSFRERNRFTLRKAWSKLPFRVESGLPAIGPFRLVNNAGDYLSRVNYASGGANMVPTRPGLPVVTTKDGGQLGSPNEVVPGATCNPKYVYDASDFIKYRRQKAINRGYANSDPFSTPDYSAGGANNGAFVPRNRVRGSLPRKV
jgi:hypothetical protein